MLVACTLLIAAMLTFGVTRLAFLTPLVFAGPFWLTGPTDTVVTVVALVLLVTNTFGRQPARSAPASMVGQMRAHLDSTTAREREAAMTPHPSSFIGTLHRHRHRP